MSLENIDDLFRDKLDGHSSPPGDALWARLQAGPPAEPTPAATDERLDRLFKQGLNAHATPPSRELWERLEDEHLRPRKRRAAAWWPMALAAALALLLVAGGAGLWLGFPSGNSSRGTIATQQNPTPRNQSVAPKLQTGTAPETNFSNAAEQPATVAATLPEQPKTAAENTNQKISTSEATRSRSLASTTPKARMSAPGQSPRHLSGTNRQPDAATAKAPLVARTAARSATRPAPIRPAAADEPRPTAPPVVASLPKPATAAENVPAPAVPAPSLATTGELITVDVRSGSQPAVQPSKIANLAATVAATADAPEERRRLGGRLLQQAGHLVRGERVSLAEVTGLPENVTVRATVGGRTLTKSIQL
ncbi:hypothetical protein [Hymenobacter arizonensis]|uniref:Uncharacterized protein n=1 Tax=Hymenobacter arizonensis TaxID=1227077 RepID=A0A1I5TZ64_HYMAR|nr:hypothetical protein [Hymenobacter arizonensis]SFP88333.1 hypothetical protein SAMN04515668_0675 [Hymenobacter arizonensis]